MGKIGKTRGTPNPRVQSTKTTNKAGGVGYTFADPVQRLIGTMGAYMGEPGYYPDKATIHNTQRHTSGADLSIFDERGQQIATTAIEIAQGKNPEDLLVLAHWARKELKMRLVPQILFAIALHFIKGIRSHDHEKTPVFRYAPHIMTRADDILQAFSLNYHMFGKPSKNGKYKRSVLSNGAKKALAYALYKQSDAQILKYHQSKTHPNFVDLVETVRWVKPPDFAKGKDNWPMNRGLIDYLKTGKVTERAPQVLRSRKKFFALNPDKAPLDSLEELAREAGLTWENIYSHFGKTTPARKERVWEICYQQMGYMARLRNVRNFLEHAPGVAKLAASYLKKPENVASSKQLPFRFLSAWKAIQKEDPNFSGYSWYTRSTFTPVACDEFARQKVSDSLVEALEASVANLPQLEGPTAIFIDSSGSMGSYLSEKGSVTVFEAAATLGALFLKLTDGSIIRLIDSNLHDPKCSRTSSVMDNIMKMKDMNNGGATNLHKCVEYLTKRKLKVNRIILCTDNVGYNGSVDTALKEYRRKVNPDAFMYLLDQQSYGHSSVNTDSKRFLQISGYSDGIIRQIQMHENKVLGLTDLAKSHGKTLTAKEQQAVTIEGLRQEFTVQPWKPTGVRS